MKIATSTGDFREYLDWDDAATATKLLAQCGFKHVDVNMYHSFDAGSALCSDNWREWADGIRRAGAEAGADFVQAHGSDGCFDPGEERDRRIEILKREMHVCQMLGIPRIVVHGVWRRGGSREEFMAANARFYRELLPTAEKTGVCVCTENTCRQNLPEYYIFEGSDFNELRERLGRHPLFGCCWDVGHANCHGVDQYKCIRELGDGLKAVHIHDTNFGADAHMAPFQGSVSYDAVINGLLDADFKGYFTLESYSLPISPRFCKRKRFTDKGPDFERLLTLPLEFKMRSEKFMLDVVRYMLNAYDCLDE